MCPRRLGLSRPNVACASGPALHDRGSEVRYGRLAEIGVRSSDGTILAEYRDTDSRDLCRLNHILTLIFGVEVGPEDLSRQRTGA